MTIRNCDRHSSASDGPRVPGKPKLGRQCEVFLCSYFVLIEYLRGLSTNHDMPPKSSTHPVDSNSPPMPNPLKLALTGPLQLPLSQSLPKSVASTSPRTSLFFQPMPLPLPCTGDLFSMTITQIPPIYERPHAKMQRRKEIRSAQADWWVSRTVLIGVRTKVAIRLS